MNKHQRRHLRWMLFGLQNGQCFYCQDPMILSFSGRESLWDNAATFEHLQRKADGGPDTRANMGVLACRRCNRLRGDRDWSDYRVARMDGRTG